jgi:hypothetical protein
MLGFLGMSLSIPLARFAFNSGFLFMVMAILRKWITEIINPFHFISFHLNLGHTPINVFDSAGLCN